METAIRNATVVNADGSASADILVREGRIMAVGPDAARGVSPSAQVDATGLYALPGGIDPHTHLDMAVAGTRTADDFATGGNAALAGGTTTVIDFATSEPGQSLLAAHDEAKRRAHNATCDHAFHCALPFFDATVAEQMGTLVRERGVRSFKHYMTYKGAVMLDPDALIHSFARVAALGGLATVHAENDAIIDYLRTALQAAGKTHPRHHPVCRPDYGEAEATTRAIALARAAGVALYIVHCSCELALDAVRRARTAGQEVYAEVLGGHLSVDVSVYDQPDPREAARYVMSPPFRLVSDREALWHGLADGAVQTTGSDNCAFTDQQRCMHGDDFTKLLNGAAGLQERMRAVWQGVHKGTLSPQQFVAATSANAARIFGLPTKGAIRPGMDADIVLWDPQATYTSRGVDTYHAVDHTPYEGMTFTGGPVATHLAGREVMREGRVMSEPGSGRLLSCTRS